jgi:hypothetical protein
MSTSKNGGAAFPGKTTTVIREPYKVDTTEKVVEHGGMTLRDYFAGQALMGLMASRNNKSPHFHPKHDTEYVYQMADAMLAAREVQS